MEYCNKSNSIKYLFKYVNKGPDRVTVAITQETLDPNKKQLVDEIKQFYDCRYLSSYEAVWRSFAFDIHERWPAVQRLTFHLPNEQNIIYKDEDVIQDIVSRNRERDTMFLAWFKANQIHNDGRNLTYSEFPSLFFFNKDEMSWQPRKRGFSIGRLHYVPPGTGELYYMRILLTIQRGCTSFESIRTVNGVTYPTFQDACYSLGLLFDDREYIEAIKEASELGSGNQLRKLFVVFLLSNSMSNPEHVWDNTWEILTEGILN